MKRSAACLALGVLMSTAMAANAATENWKQKFAQLSDQYFDQLYFPYAPTQGTLVGYHQYDTKLEDYSRKNIDAEIAALKNYLTQFESIDTDRQRSRAKTQAGEPGSRGILFMCTRSKAGKIDSLKLLRKDPGLTAEQVRLLSNNVLAATYPPLPQNRPTNFSPNDVTDNHFLVGVTLDDFDPTAADLSIVKSNINSQLLTLETIRPWEKNADIYSSTCANAAFVLMERKFASPDDRLRSLIAREKQMPDLLAQARINLQNPPRIFTEIAIEQLPGIISFFQTDVPQAFAEAKDEKVKADFAKSNAAVIESLQKYLAWLKSDALPQSNGDYRIGAKTFSDKLKYDEMVDIPLDRLLEIGWADLRNNQEQFKKVAHELEPDKTPAEVLEELGKNHPAPGQLLDSFRATFTGLMQFIRTHNIVTIPSDVKPIVEETPPFMRATTFASMDTPGPFETHATEAYFNVTLPDPKMTPAEVEGYMHSFNVGTVISTAVHEAYPGHYVQFLRVPNAPSRVRKILGANTNVEGWAHYTEQMMLDNGYGQPGAGAKDEREAKFLRLGQLQDALLRNTRFIVGIEMHTGKMSIEQAEAFFQKEGYQSKETAVVETKRGAGDPTYLYYTLGKLQIMKLRQDLQKKQGSAFSLQKFHDDFLKQGFPPVKIVREAMLGDNSPTL